MNKTINTQAVLSMRSEGYYSERTAGARDVINNALPMVLDALKNIPEYPVLRIADFGAADGGTSREMWNTVISALRQNKDQRQIELCYTDLASNDFSSLFRMMQGMQGDSKFAIQKNHENVFVHGCGTGFHRQLLSNSTLHLGFSATAMHYVSSKPLEIPNHLHATRADEKSKAAFAEQAASDWQNILLARAAELVPGGRFICLNFGIDEHGRYLGNTGGKHMFDNFHKFWHKLLTSGTINENEYQKATFAQYYRTAEEFCAPFLSPTSPVRKAGLVLKSCRSELTRCPYQVAFLNACGSMSAAEYADSLIPTLRSWSETVFKTALAGRKDTEIVNIVDEFYKSYHSEVVSNPDGHAMDYVHIILDIEKVV